MVYTKNGIYQKMVYTKKLYIPKNGIYQKMVYTQNVCCPCVKIYTKKEYIPKKGIYQIMVYTKITKTMGYVRSTMGLTITLSVQGGVTLRQTML